MRSWCPPSPAQGTDLCRGGVMCTGTRADISAAEVGWGWWWGGAPELVRPALGIRRHRGRVKHKDARQGEGKAKGGGGMVLAAASHHSRCAFDICIVLYFWW